MHATLLDQGRYLGSVRTMYRLLAADGGSRERRRQLVHPAHAKPELLATAPNQVWSWDITKLKGPAKWTCFHLYVILDIFSRHVVGWLIAERESAELAEQLIAETVARHAVPPASSPCTPTAAPACAPSRWPRFCSISTSPGATAARTSRTTTRTRRRSSRPWKYRPDFPARFGGLADARAHCQAFFAWYNARHRHSGIGFMTPHNVHYGHAEALHAARQAALDAAFTAHPERFKNRRPQPPELPTAVWINPPPTPKETPPETQPCTFNS